MESATELVGLASAAEIVRVSNPPCSLKKPQIIKIVVHTYVLSTSELCIVGQLGEGSC